MLVKMTYRSVSFSNPPLTFSAFARSINSGMSSLAAPTKIANRRQSQSLLLDVSHSPTDRAMHLWPAAPKAAPATAFSVRFRLAASHALAISFQSGDEYTHHLA